MNIENLHIKENCYFLRNYLNLSYFLCHSPFCYKFKNGHFLSSSWWPQKVYCAISSSLSVLWIAGELRAFARNESSRKAPDFYLRVMRLIAYTFQKSVILTKFWTHKKMFLKTLNFLQSVNVQFKTPLSTTSKLAIRLIAQVIVGLYIIIGLAYFCDGLNVLAHQNTDKFGVGAVWESLIVAGKHNYFLDYIFKTPNRTNITSILDNVVGIASMIGNVPRQFLSAYFDLLALVLIITLWIETKSFLTALSIKQPKFNNNVVEGLKAFENLKRLTELVNQVLGINMCLYILEIVFGCAFYLDFLVEPAEPQYSVVTNIVSAFYFGNLLIPIILAADVEHKVKSFKTWIRNEHVRQHLSMEQIFLTINEIDDHAISVQGSNIFPITYFTLTSVMSLTVTYFLLCVQYSK